MSRVITVSDAAGLRAALQDAQSGDEISLTGGDYGKLLLKPSASLDVDFPEGVVIKSADPDDQAVFTGLDLRGVSNLRFESVTFDYQYAAGDPVWLRPFQVQDSSNVQIVDAAFVGDFPEGVSEDVDGFGTGVGLSVRDSSDITIADSTLTGFHRGVIVSGSEDVTLSGNELWDMRSDGINAAGVTGLVIVDNHIHDFRVSPTSTDHPDMIQIWTNGTTSPSTDIVIDGNLLDIGQGDPVQSIFIRNDVVDRGLAGAEMFYQRVTITDNVIVNGQTHGITVGETDGLMIANNTVVHSDGGYPDGVDSSVEIPRIEVANASVNVTIADNITSDIAGDVDQASWQVSGNAIVQDQDPFASGYYEDVFLASSLDLDAGGPIFQADPFGPLQGAGAAATYGGVVAGPAVVQFQVSEDPDNVATRIFDAAAAGAGETAVFTWDFGDGTTGTGTQVSHQYGNGGEYDVVLTVTYRDGQIAEAQSRVQVDGSEALSLNVDGSFSVHDAGSSVVVEGGPQADTGGLLLGESGVVASVDKSHVREMLYTDDVDIFGALGAIGPDSYGEVFRLHGSLLVEVTRSGELSVRAWDADGGAHRLITQGADLSDGDIHKFSISLSNDVLRVAVDEVEISTEMTATFQDKGALDLMFGNPWGKTNFDGVLTAFEIHTNVDDFAVPVTTAADSFEFVAAEFGPEAAPELITPIEASPETAPEWGNVTEALDLSIYTTPISEEILL